VRNTTRADTRAADPTGADTRSATTHASRTTDTQISFADTERARTVETFVRGQAQESIEFATIGRREAVLAPGAASAPAAV